MMPRFFYVKRKVLDKQYKVGVLFREDNSKITLEEKSYLKINF